MGEFDLLDGVMAEPSIGVAHKQKNAQHEGHPEEIAYPLSPPACLTSL